MIKYIPKHFNKVGICVLLRHLNPLGDTRNRLATSILSSYPPEPYPSPLPRPRSLAMAAFFNSVILNRITDSDRRARIMAALVANDIRGDMDLIEIAGTKTETELTQLLKDAMNLSILDASSLSSAIIKSGKSQSINLD